MVVSMDYILDGGKAGSIPVLDRSGFEAHCCHDLSPQLAIQPGLIQPLMMTLKQVYELMLYELQSNRLHVVLVPSQIPECAKDGGKIRAVCSQNIEWYQELCSMYPRLTTRNLGRKNPRTRVNRCDVERVLSKMIKGEKVSSRYADYLKDTAESYLKNYDMSDEEVKYFMRFNELMEPFDNQF